ncbi:anti-sigma factor [Streptomyces venezuelae]|uniref:Regulator of SigK n=1 Tax=Streptomyces venezuelae TaxID=54571 RepID=A0A5P2DFD3_STRVZ|nr:anti-sigma factor [Streptomyces venezuelae]QES53493.1 anti-sigma factor [Streptomyces venezuelae]
MNTADPHTLTGAYVLDALDPGERTSVERHLAGCPSCAQEVREFSETVTRLGLAVAAPPSAALRDEVMRRIATVRQEPPRAVKGAHGNRAKPRWRPASNWALAACFAAAVALGGVAVSQYGQAEEARQQAQQARVTNDAVGSILAAADARVATAPLRGGAVGTVVVSASRNQAVFAASGMPAPPSGKVYQLWYDDGGGRMRSAGLMDTGTPATATLLDGPVNAASGMGVTVEPAGGSPLPTSAPVALLAFPAA